LDAVFHQKSNIYEGVFSNNQPCQYFMERTGFFGQPKLLEAYNIILFFMENSILEISGSMDGKITPDIVS
jgi:hypothetical protein